MTETIFVDYHNKTLIIPHLGITMRSMMAAAANGNEGQVFQRNWTLVYKDMDVGRIKLKKFKE